MIFGLKLLHSHGRVVGFAHDAWFHYPHKPPVKYTCPHISLGLYALACLNVGCPGSGFEEHNRRHAEEHRAYRERNEQPPESYEDYDL